jgi:acetylornithine aminotransferase
LPGIKEVRGYGLMIGIEMDQPIKEKRAKLLYEEKIFTGSSATNIFRLLPPLNLTKELADEFLTKFRKVI